VSISIDHIVLAVQDLKKAAQTIHRILGREAVPCGEHEESGTAHMIVSLADSYLELVTVVDHTKAVTHPFGRLIAGGIASSTVLVGWAAAVGCPADKPNAAGLGEHTLTRSNTRLSLYGLDSALDRPDRPFLIRRQIPGTGIKPNDRFTGKIHRLHVAAPDNGATWPPISSGPTEVDITDSSAVRGAIISITVDDIDGIPTLISENSWRDATHFVNSSFTQAARLERMRADRRALHRMPEVGLHLPRTQAYLLDALAQLGLEITTGVGLSSITAILRGKGMNSDQTSAGARTARRAVLVRSDMDALPMTEATGLPFASDNGAMHACGHDLHMAMLLECARSLVEKAAELTGDVILVFQPGEENHGGARMMLGEGLLRSDKHEIIASFGLHVLSYQLPSKAVGIREGSIMAGSTIVTVKFQGKGGHGSAPHRTHDPLLAGASFVPAVTAALAHGIDMFAPNVLTFGSFISGSTTNVIPDNAELRGTLRSFSGEVARQARSIVERVAHSTAQTHQTTAEVTFEEICLPVVNDRYEISVVAAAAETAGARVMWLEQPISVSEDFSYVLEANRGAFALLGAVDPSADASDVEANHSARARFDEDVLPIGADLMTSWAISRLRETP
jgi:amidohydrolase